MARARLPIVLHLSPAEIARRYRACRDGVEKTHWQILWLLTRSEPPPAPAEVAAQVGLTPAWTRTVLRRWNAEGPAGLVDRRPARNGGRPKLSDEQQAALFEALQGRPADGGLWTGPKVAAYARDRWGVTVRVETGWRWLNRLGFSLQVPHSDQVKEYSNSSGSLRSSKALGFLRFVRLTVVWSTAPSSSMAISSLKGTGTK